MRQQSTKRGSETDRIRETERHREARKQRDGYRETDRETKQREAEKKNRKEGLAIKSRSPAPVMHFLQESLHLLKVP